MQTSTHAWFNGQVCAREAGAPSVASVNFNLGTAVFDGMVAYWNHDHYYLHCGEEHFARFRDGSARLGLPITWSVEQMVQGVHDLLAVEPKGTQYIRPIAYRRVPWLFITGTEQWPVDVSVFAVPMPRDTDETITCQLSPVERISSRSIPGQTKVSGSYVNSYWARRTAESAGFTDGIMVDREGRLTEASAANLFVIRGDRLLTPPLNPEVFPGITRQVIKSLARREGIECREVDLRAEDLRSIDGCFLCSTYMEIRAVSRLEQRPLGTPEHPVFRTVLGAFRRLVHEQH